MIQMENKNSRFQALRGGILADAPGLGTEFINFILTVFGSRSTTIFKSIKPYKDEII